MTSTSNTPRNITATIAIQPTNFSFMKAALESLGRNFEGPSRMTPEASANAFQGSISNYDAQTSVSVSYLTDTEQIQALLPPGKNLEVNGPPVVTVSAVYQGGIKWLAGRSYNLLLVMVPVVHHGKNGKTYGQFLPVVWENMTEPIMMGRETLGWPKIYADLPPVKIYNDTVQCIAHWYGYKFLDINVQKVRNLTEAEIKQRTEAAAQAPQSAGLISHKFILKTGAFMETDADYLTISTNEGAAAGTIREVLTGKADISFIRGTFDQLPTMGHIIERLAAMEVKEVYDAMIVTQTGGGMGATKMLE